MRCCFFAGGLQYLSQCNSHANKRYLAKTMPDSNWHDKCIKSPLMQQICHKYGLNCAICKDYAKSIHRPCLINGIKSPIPAIPRTFPIIQKTTNDDKTILN